MHVCVAASEKIDKTLMWTLLSCKRDLGKSHIVVKLRYIFKDYLFSYIDVNFF